MRRVIVTTVLAAVFSGAGAATAAAQGAFLYVPTIPGEATTEGYRDWIDLHSLSQGATDQKVSGGCFVTLTKALGKAGPKLWAASVSGQNLGEVKVHLVQLDGQLEPRLLYDLVLTNARSTSINTSASAGGSVTSALCSCDRSTSPSRVAWPPSGSRPHGDHRGTGLEA